MRRWIAHYGAEHRARHRRRQRPGAGARSHGEERSASTGRSTLGGRVLPTGIGARDRAWAGLAAAGLRRRRLVGAGRRRRAAGAAARRRARQVRSPISAPRPAARPRSSPPPARRSPRSTARPPRLARLRQNLARLQLDGRDRRRRRHANGRRGPFDAVLLDAPCSSTGTIRRHPDIPWLKREADLAELAALQRRLLDHAVDAGQAGRHAGLLHLLARAGGRRARSSRRCSARDPRLRRGPIAAGRGRRPRRAAHAGRRPAHPALPSARSRPAHGRPRRLLRRPAAKRFEGRSIAQVGRCRQPFAICLRGPSAGHAAPARAREASAFDGARFDRGADQAVPAPGARRACAGSPAALTRHPLDPLAVLPPARPTGCDRAAGPAHRRRAPARAKSMPAASPSPARS